MKVHLSSVLVAVAVTGIIICLPCCNEQDETTVTDIDGNVYHTVITGNQVWMAENLKTTHYRNGDPVTNVAGNTNWAELISGAWPFAVLKPNFKCQRSEQLPKLLVLYQNLRGGAVFSYST